MNIISTPLAGLYVVASVRQVDQRGEFSRVYCERELSPILESRRIVQVNRSLTRAIGTIRGLHFQHSPYAEMKLVRCLHGRVWDVAIDLRAGSPTFLQWVGQELSQKNGLMMAIPEGFAHGFQALEADSEMLYMHTAFYAPEAEGGVHCQDPRLNIEWPLPINDLSVHDRHHPLLSSDFLGIMS